MNSFEKKRKKGIEKKICLKAFLREGSQLPNVIKNGGQKTVEYGPNLFQNRVMFSELGLVLK